MCDVRCEGWCGICDGVRVHGRSRCVCVMHKECESLPEATSVTCTAILCAHRTPLSY